MKDLHDIDKLFNDGLGEHREPVPPGIWEGISNDLDKKQTLHFQKKYYRLKRWAAALLLFGFVSGAFVFYYFTEEKTGSINLKQKNLPGVRDIKYPASPDNNSTINLSTIAAEKKSSATPSLQNQEKLSAKESQRLPKDSFAKDGVFNENEIERSPRKQGAFLLPLVQLKAAAESTNSSLKNKNVYAGNKLDGYNSKRELRPSADVSLQTSSAKLANEYLPTHSFNLFRLLPLSNVTRNDIAPKKIGTPSKLKTSAKHEFSLTAFVAPNLNFSRLEDDKHLARPGRDRNEARKDEQHASSFSAGFLLNYGLTKNLHLQSGAIVSTSTTDLSPKIIYARPDNNGNARYELHCSSGYSYIAPKTGAALTVGDSIQTSGSRSKLTYVSVPFSVSYGLQNGRLTIEPGVGVAANFLASGKTKTDLTNNTTNEMATTSITGLKSMYVDGLISVRIEYNLNKRFSVGLLPTARLAVSPINKETPVKSYQNYLSVGAGIKIKL